MPKHLSLQLLGTRVFANLPRHVIVNTSYTIKEILQDFIMRKIFK